MLETKLEELKAELSELRGVIVELTSAIRSAPVPTAAPVEAKPVPTAAPVKAKPVPTAEPTAAPVKAKPVPTAAPDHAEVSRDDLQDLCMAIVRKDRSKKAAVKDAIAAFGNASTLKGVAESDLAALKVALEALQ